MCNQIYHTWKLSSNSTDTLIRPYPGQPCGCGQYTWPSKTPPTDGIQPAQESGQMFDEWLKSRKEKYPGRAVALFDAWQAALETARRVAYAIKIECDESGDPEGREAAETIESALQDIINGNVFED